MQLLSTKTSWDGDLEAAYDQAVEAWRSSPAPGEEQYRATVFPLSCERIRRARAEDSPLDLLFVPVGTQSYAPILATLANPARLTVLLHTAESQPHAECVRQSLPVQEFVPIQINGSDALDIAAKMRDVYHTRGLPPGSQVGADITGGRKPTSATIAAVGSSFRWRLFYIDGTQERLHNGLAHHEKVIVLPSMLDVFGVQKREILRALIDAECWRAALRQLRGLMDESLASARDRQLQRLLKTLYRWDTVDLDALPSLLGPVMAHAVLGPMSGSSNKERVFQRIRRRCRKLAGLS